MEMSLKEAADELERIANRRYPAMQRLDETREAYQKRVEDALRYLEGRARERGDWRGDGKS